MRCALAWLGLCLASLATDRPPFAAAQYSLAVCPNVRARSLQVCDRCVADDLCPTIDGTDYKCDMFTKRCVSPSWNRTEVPLRCPEDPKSPSTRGAMCQLQCEEQTAPFSCAAQRCLNPDFPCRWVPNCYPPVGLSLSSGVCLQSCQDHEDMLPMLYGSSGVRTCAAAVSRYGCGASWLSIPDICPVTCKSGLCQFLCSRDEEPAIGGKQCWQRVEQEGISCVEAIRSGMDCHCKCGYIYFAVGNTGRFSQGAAFGPQDVVLGVPLGLYVNATAGRSFFVSLTGQALRTTNVGNADGPRIKVIQQGDACGSGNAIKGVAGLVCDSLSSSSSASACSTPPQLTTRYVHRWTPFTISVCGNFDLCHCNGNCDAARNWRLAGSVAVRPAWAIGGVPQSLPGCTQYFRQLPSIVLSRSNESLSNGVVAVLLSISGGLDGSSRTLEAVRSSLVSFLTFESPRLGTVPALADVTVSKVDAAARRLVGRFRRMQGTCEDDDAKFAAEAKRVNFPLTSCAQALALRPVAALCSDPTLLTAVTQGCKKMCGFCSISSPSTSSTLAPATGASGSSQAADGTSTSTLTTTTTTWPGGPGALHVSVEVQTKSDMSADYIVARLRQISVDPTTFVQAIYLELVGAGVTTDAMPAALWVYTASTAGLRVIVPEAPKKEEPSWTTSKTIIAAIGGAVAAAILLPIMGVCIWCYLSRSREVKVAVEPEETVTVSDGGYRLKRSMQEAGDAPAPPSEPGCQPCRRCYRRFCTRRLKRVQLPSQVRAAAAAEGQLEVGTAVRLAGLSQAQYNGLIGHISSGPNEKGRYMVDVVLTDDESAREVQTLSFRPENLQPVRLYEGAEAAAPQGSRVGGSYRSGKR